MTFGTQASTKVYRTKPDGEPAKQTLNGTVHPGGLLVNAPDPLVPFAKSAFVGSQRFELHNGASLVSIDWLSSGRATCGERWAFASYASRTEVFLRGCSDDQSDAPVLVEALTLPRVGLAQRAMGFDIGGVARDAAVSVVVAGPRGAEVAKRLHDAAAIIAQRRSGGGARDAREHSTPSLLNDTAATVASQGEAALGSQLLGDLTLGVCDVEVGSQAAPPDGYGNAAGTHLTVARLVAEHNEDVYRLLHFCLSLLAMELGTTPYTDRIHATMPARPARLDAVQKAGGRHGEHRSDKWRRAPVISHQEIQNGSVLEPSPDLRPYTTQGECKTATPPGTALSNAQLLHIMHLCDTTLPTGGFAHSGGLEAAMQFGLLGSRRAAGMVASLRELGITSAVSAAQQQAPFALAAHALVSEALPHLDDRLGAWPASEAEVALSDAMAVLNARQHALLAANGPGCRASLLQGSTLARIASSWVGGTEASKIQGSAAAAAARGVAILPTRGCSHGAPALGALAALLGLPARTVVDAFVYMTARDFFSAAVRLNLVGPLAAVSLQSDVVGAEVIRSDDLMQLSCADAAGAAPLLEAVHACHDLLERRIFQT